MAYEDLHVKWHKPTPTVPNHGKLWTDRDNQKLTKMIRRTLAWTDIARTLGRTESACQLQAERIGVFNPNQPATAIISKDLNVNYTHIITLLQEGYTTCHVALDNSKAYTYKIPKDAGIVAGDRVVVPTQETFSVGRVTAVHEEPDIDFNAPYALKWVVQKIDFARYDEQTVKEAAALHHLTQIKRKKSQEAAIKSLFGDAEGLEEFKKLING